MKGSELITIIQENNLQDFEVKISVSSYDQGSLRTDWMVLTGESKILYDGSEVLALEAED